MLNKKYLGGASFILDELFNSVTPEDKINMKKLFSDIPTEQYSKYRNQVSEDMFKYIRSTPEQRADNEKWNQGEYRLKLIYFSFVSVQRGYLLMTRLAAIPKRTSNGDAYRRVTAVFSSMMDAVCNSKLKDSIFNDELSYEDYN